MIDADKTILGAICNQGESTKKERVSYALANQFYTDEILNRDTLIEGVDHYLSIREHLTILREKGVV